MARNRRLGPEEFELFYQDLFGPRWPSLRSALLGEAIYAELRDGYLEPYFVDRASLLAARALDVQPGERVLDLCAAPGGKTLVLATALAGSGELIANERSATRRNRLHRVLQNHLPERLRSPISVTGHDASKWGIHEQLAYDRVLADVPCSSERHVIASASALSTWSPSRTRRLAIAAYAIACAGGDALKEGGRMVYSTCALSPLENDGVVDRLLSRASGELAIKRLESVDGGEPTEYGHQIMPDTDGGMGPIYFAIIERQGLPLTGPPL